jgi:CubicO group peptidase (beta-lactamase class C family)
MENASPGIHFRIASSTRTFAAAAILLRHQRGLLDIDDLITANIPGAATPYVPDSPGCDAGAGDPGVRIRLLAYSAFRDAMSMEKRYFTSDFSIRS